MNFRELLMGPAYFYHRSLIEKSKSWNSSDIDKYQSKQVFPVYDKYGEALRDKEHYRSNQGLYDLWSIPGIVKTIRTGGTTGTPFSFKMDRLFRRQKERAYIFDIWSSVGYSPFDMRVIFRGGISDKIFKYDPVENAWTISANQINKESIEKVKEFLLHLDPFFLHVYPSSLFSFIRLLGKGFFLSLPIRGILAGSESFLPSQLELFKKEYNIPVAHWYGHSEYGALARYCEECGGFHFYPTYGFTELIPTDNDLYRIVVTSFNKIGTKFIRYDTGDLAVRNDELCGAPFMRVKSIIGRSQDFFWGADGSQYAFGPFLFGIHNEFWDEIDNIQFLQDKPGEIVIKIVDNTHTRHEWLESFLKDRFKVVKVKTSYVASIDTTKSGKHRYFVNNIS